MLYNIPRLGSRWALEYIWRHNFGTLKGLPSQLRGALVCPEHCMTQLVPYHREPHTRVVCQLVVHHPMNEWNDYYSLWQWLTVSVHFSVSIDESKSQDVFQAVDLPESYHLLSQYVLCHQEGHLCNPGVPPGDWEREGHLFLPGRSSPQLSQICHKIFLAGKHLL